LGSVRNERASFRLCLLLDLMAEPVGIAISNADGLWCGRARGSDVEETREGGRGRRLPRCRIVGMRAPTAAEAIEIVDKASGGLTKQPAGYGQWIERLKQLGRVSLSWLGNESIEAIAL